MAIDPQLYRETLGHYPTGVVLVTATGADGVPLGLVIGSFTSLSLDPPQVAFMPMRSSGTFAQIQQIGSFCVNVLAADQLDTCRVFASRAEDKFAGVDWHPAPVTGSPVLDGAVSWLDCEISATLDGGDHFICIGDIKDLGVQRRELPLLFFQGGYGRFATASLVAPSTPELVASVRVADSLRPQMEALASEESADVSVIAETGDWMTFVASAAGSETPANASIGLQLPLVPPLGSVFVDPEGPTTVESWVARLPRGSEEIAERAHELAAKVDRDGHSLSLLGEESDEQIWHLADELANGSPTPDREREITRLLVANFDSYEPEIRDKERYDVRAVIVPIPTQPGTPRLALRFANPPGGASSADVQRWIERTKACARSVDA
ncbi:MAG: flavin reductase family protein [Propionibacteriaceae bacterium]|nr:flavin reductase family protein [Propionibacteriaceae bacterium]